MGKPANVIGLFAHRAARARNQTRLGRIDCICKALVKHGRVYLSVHAPKADLTEQWLQSLRVEVRTDLSDTVHVGRIERLDSQDGPFSLLVSEVLSPLPASEVRANVQVTLLSACGTFCLKETADAVHQASR